MFPGTQNLFLSYNFSFVQSYSNYDFVVYDLKRVFQSMKLPLLVLNPHLMDQVSNLQGFFINYVS